MGAAKPRAPIVNVLLAMLLLWSVGLRVWLATEGLNANHYWDERYNVKNLRRIVVAGELEPGTYYYTALSWLPQAAVLSGSQWIARRFEPAFSWFDGGDLRPMGYLVCRLLQVLYGAASILLTFVIGRRLFSPATGLIAALLLASSPVHIRLSTFFKPDVLLVFLVLLALWLALLAAAMPTWRRFLLAGAGVGLAMSSKLNGGPAALPVTIAALAHAWRDRSQLLRLAGAGVTAAAVFLIINPRVDRYLGALERNQEIYAQHDHEVGVAARALQVARDGATTLLSATFHGTVVGLLAGAGAVLLIAQIVRYRRDADRVLPWVMLLSFPLAYLGSYALATAYVKPNNLLPILPVSSLLAALLVVEAWRAAERRLAALRATATRALAGAGLAVAIAYPAQSWVYQQRTRTTWEVAFEEVAAALRPWSGRVARFEQLPSGLIWRQRPLRAMVGTAPDVALQARRDPEQLDAAVFAASSAESSVEAQAIERWRSLSAAEVREVRPRLFMTRGPDLVVLLRPPEELSARELTADQVLRIPLDAVSVGERVSLAFTLPAAIAAPTLREVGSAGDSGSAIEVDVTVKTLGRASYYLSRRLMRCPGEPGPEALELAFDGVPPPRFTATLYRFAADCSPASDGSALRR